MTLPIDKQARKNIPIATGCIDYFPDAIAEIAHLSWVGNEQHNPGTPLHWDRSKSGDEADAAMRHFLQRGTFDEDGVRHSAKFAWRALALLQKEIERERKDDKNESIWGKCPCGRPGVMSVNTTWPDKYTPEPRCETHSDKATLVAGGYVEK